MGYYINKFLSGVQYDLEGTRLQFVEKRGNLFAFFICKMDTTDFQYKPTAQMAYYAKEDLEYIKRIQEGSINKGLRKIGRDKVFARN